MPKMAHYERTVYSPRRLKTPLKRTGPKGSGEFAPISWDQALAEIAASWKKIIAEKGPEAILPYSYAAPWASSSTTPCMACFIG